MWNLLLAMACVRKHTWNRHEKLDNFWGRSDLFGRYEDLQSPPSRDFCPEKEHSFKPLRSNFYR